jgi:hypothetical protein
MKAHLPFNANDVPTTQLVPDHGDPWIDVHQAALHGNVSTATIRRAMRGGKLRHARVGGGKLLRTKPSWIDEWYEQTTTPKEVHRAPRRGGRATTSEVR